MIADRLGHRFPPGPWLFTDLTFTLLPGCVTGLAGPSGSGKTTLLGIIAGWISPIEGKLERIGVTKPAWVFQNPVGVRRRTALDHVVLPLLAQGLRRPEAERDAMLLLEDFGLADAVGRSFQNLSGGESQRLMLARAVASKPDLLLIDEPTAQLDPISAATVTETLGALARAGMIVVVSSHDERLQQACASVVRLGES